MDVGIVIDLETTGTDHKKDSIIEVGILEFGITSGNKVPKILSMYSALEDPQVKLESVIKEITGIDDEMLKNQKIDWSTVQSYFRRASIVIAHHAAFDRGFILQRPEMKEFKNHWGCSIKHVPWKKKGFNSKSLTYLAADHGFLNPFAHRALFDCATTFRVIAPYLDALISNSYEPEVCISAVGAAFDKKDILRSNDYRWDAEKRVWHKTVFKYEYNEEISFLEKSVYLGPSRHQEEVSFFNS